MRCIKGEIFYYYSLACSYFTVHSIHGNNLGESYYDYIEPIQQLNSGGSNPLLPIDTSTNISYGMSVVSLAPRPKYGLVYTVHTCTLFS